MASAGEPEAGAASAVGLLDSDAGGAATGVLLPDDEAPDDAVLVALADDELPDAAAGAPLPALKVDVGAGAVALPGEVVLANAPPTPADEPLVADDAKVVGVDEAVNPPPDADVTVGVMGLVWSIARATFHSLRSTMFVPSFGTTSELMSLSTLLTRFLLSETGGRPSSRRDVRLPTGDRRGDGIGRRTTLRDEVVRQPVRRERVAVGVRGIDEPNCPRMPRRRR